MLPNFRCETPPRPRVGIRCSIRILCTHLPVVCRSLGQPPDCYACACPSACPAAAATAVVARVVAVFVTCGQTAGAPAQSYARLLCRGSDRRTDLAECPG